jgi:Tfp pilus assembly protein PilZ
MELGLKQKENRSSPRLDFNSRIRFQLRGKPDFANGTSNDISSGGLRFVTDKFVPTATPVMLEINVLNRILRPIGKVAWSMPLAHSNRSQLGVEFVEFNALEKNYLNDFVNMQLG